MNFSVNERQKMQWLRAKRRFLQEIEWIDAETLWEEKEPAWWLAMQDVRRATIETGETQ